MDPLASKHRLALILTSGQSQLEGFVCLKINWMFWIFHISEMLLFYIVLVLGGMLLS